MNNNDKFLEMVKRCCNKNKISFVLSPTHVVDSGDGIECSGFFSDITNTLAVAQLSHNWFSVLIHEFCHMCQWSENSPLWINRGEINPWFWKAVLGEISINDQHFHQAIDRQLEVELDCEKRTVKYILDNKFPIDIISYIKGANAYILYYTFIKKYKTWYKKPPYNVDEINHLMPIDLQEFSWYTTLPKEYELLVQEKCL